MSITLRNNSVVRANVVGLSKHPYEGMFHVPNPSSGSKHQKGEQVIAMTDNHGDVLCPLPVAPVHETDMTLLPKGLKVLKKVATKVGFDLKGASVNLDAGFDATHNRQCIFNAGMIPNIPEHPRK